MELKACEYCGTAYDARLRQCPLCGRAAAGQTGSAEPERTAAAPEKAAQSAPAPERPAPGRRLRQDAGAPKAARGYAGKRLRTASAPQPSDAQSAPGEAVYAIPKWMMTVLCVILGAAVLGGALLGVLFTVMLRFFKVQSNRMVLAIAFVAQLAADLCREAGLAAAAFCMEFVGRILAMLQALPLLQSLLASFLSFLS